MSDEGSPSEDSTNSRPNSYAQYNAPISTATPPNIYHQQERGENSDNAYNSDTDYSKIPNYPTRSSGPSQTYKESQDQQQYHERYTAPASSYQPSLENQPGLINGFEYDIRDGLGGSTLAASPTPSDYSYYQDKTESVEVLGNAGQGSTEGSLYSQILEYRPGTRPEGGQSLNNGDYERPGDLNNNDDINSGSQENKQMYSQYPSEAPQKTQQSEAYSEREVDVSGLVIIIIVDNKSNG